VALQIKVELGRMSNFAIDDCPCPAVAGAVCISLALREEPGKRNENARKMQNQNGQT
jgi:hypothetical protein